MLMDVSYTNKGSGCTKRIASVMHKILVRSNRQLFSNDTDLIENDASNNPFIVACVFVAAVKFLPRGCLATVGG
jgi:hypothetical protein